MAGKVKGDVGLGERSYHRQILLKPFAGPDQKVPGNDGIVVDPEAPKVEPGFFWDHEPREPCRHFAKNACFLKRSEDVPTEGVLGFLKPEPVAFVFEWVADDPCSQDISPDNNVLAHVGIGIR